MLLTGAHVVTMDDAGTEHPDGWVQIERGVIAAVGGSAPPAGEQVDLGGAVVTPGLVNTHHHLYQTLTRARAQEANLFEWLQALYPVWARIDEESVYAAARTGLAELALSGCTTVFDHHYVFPRGTSGLIEAELRAADELGVTLVASRGRHSTARITASTRAAKPGAADTTRARVSAMCSQVQASFS